MVPMVNVSALQQKNSASIPPSSMTRDTDTRYLNPASTTLGCTQHRRWQYPWGKKYNSHLLSNEIRIHSLELHSFRRDLWELDGSRTVRCNLGLLSVAISTAATAVPDGRRTPSRAQPTERLCRRAGFLRARPSRGCTNALGRMGEIICSRAHAQFCSGMIRSDLHDRILVLQLRSWPRLTLTLFSTSPCFWTQRGRVGGGDVRLATPPDLTPPNERRIAVSHSPMIGLGLP